MDNIYKLKEEDKNDYGEYINILKDAPSGEGSFAIKSSDVAIGELLKQSNERKIKDLEEHIKRYQKLIEEHNKPYLEFIDYVQELIEKLKTGRIKWKN